MPEMLSQELGRSAFGGDPQAYAAARPPYPAQVFAALDARHPIGGSRLFEIGAGTGLATLPLLDFGPARLTAIEPDLRLTDYLATQARHPALEIVATTWEDAELAAGYDIGVSAMAFHWLDQQAALAKVRRALKPGGWWAMWWNVFGDPDEPDELFVKSGPLFRTLATPPSWRAGKRAFAVDVDARLADLVAAGFAQSSADVMRWTIRMDAAEVRSLAATFSQVVNATDDARDRFLDGLVALVERDSAARSSAAS